MTKREFSVYAIRHRDTVTRKGNKGRLCLLHFPIPAWAEREKKEGKINESLYDHFASNQYAVVFIPCYTRGMHTGELNWTREGKREMFSTLEEAEQFFDNWN